MKTKVVILNAPPNAGKDVGTAFLVEDLRLIGVEANHMEFKSSLFKMTKAAHQIPEEQWEELYKRENKEQPSYYITLNGQSCSPRQALINMSENVIKPMFGKEAFGIMASNQLVEGSVNIFSDGGFYEELLPIIKKIGRENILIIRIYREGCTYEGDSRDYLSEYDLDLPSRAIVDLENNKTEEEFYKDLSTIVWRFLYV